MLFILIFIHFLHTDASSQRDSPVPEGSMVPSSPERSIIAPEGGFPPGQMVVQEGEQLVLPSGKKIVANKPMVVQMGGLMGVPPGDLQDLRIAAKGAAVPLRTKAFLKYYEDAKCSETPIFKGTVSGFSECKEECIHRDNCRFFAFWSPRGGRKYCENYESCDPVSMDKSTSVAVYKRLNECEMEIGYGSGTYPTEIKKAFPHGIIRLSAPDRNTHCRCTTRSWMVCVIFYIEGSEEERVVKTKLNRADPVNMRPFYVMPSVIDPQRAPICFDIEGDPGTAKIFAEIEPASPEYCIHLTMCTDGTPNGMCPILQTKFISGDPVYILKSDATKIKNGRGVQCVSVTGLRKIALDEQNIQRGGFEDPFGRKKDDNSFFLAKRDYDLYWLFDDAAVAEGICQRGFVREPPKALPTAMPTEPPEGEAKKKKAKKKKKKGRVSPGPEGSSSQESSDSNTDLSGPDSPRMLSPPPQTIPEEPSPPAAAPAWAAETRSTVTAPAQAPAPAQSKIPVTVKRKPPQSSEAVAPAAAPAAQSDDDALELEDNASEDFEDLTLEDNDGAKEKSDSSDEGLTLEENERQIEVVSPRPNQPQSPTPADRLPPRRQPSRTDGQPGTSLQSHSPPPAPTSEGASETFGYPFIGAEVTLTGLNSQPELNGQVGTVISVLEDRGRVGVRIPNRKPILVKTSNVVVKSAKHTRMASSRSERPPLSRISFLLLLSCFFIYIIIKICSYHHNVKDVYIEFLNEENFI